ncbi:uncharacterized protein LY89DRAFT_733567 [Mollisia scopiformis]|uniref:Uncharacterized protein n=1 Tax=Mollisia scopiformis TaxID=149040 RepID=A0A194XC47_MOLSC|nr:uncharacterized protein LY89DRAFT_733567 [Mollisia scopiformis]KUJ17740.1 hypothetical protein LY89DRAFT_733567 [Mollisia scopiformis]
MGELEGRVVILDELEVTQGVEISPQLSQAVTEDMNEYWLTNRRRPYKRVKVLMAHWASDDLGLATEMNDLAFVFRDLYGFEVSSFLIPDYHPSAILSSVVIDFLEDSPLDTLFIYGGHGTINPPRNDSVWAASRLGEPSMPSADIQTLFEESPADSVLIYDACCSADAAVTRPTFQGVTELIASCGFQTTAPGPGRQSFTYALTNVLREHSPTKTSLAVADLYLKLLARLRHTQDRTVETTPVHCALSNKPIGRRIVFEPMGNHHPVDLSTVQTPYVYTFSFAADTLWMTYEAWLRWKDWITKAPPEAYFFMGARVSTY